MRQAQAYRFHVHFTRTKRQQIFVLIMNVCYQCVQYVYQFIVNNIVNKIHMDNSKGKNIIKKQVKYEQNKNSIQQIIQKISSILLHTNKSLQDLSQQYTQDYWNKKKLLQQCKQTLNSKKKKLIRQIQRKFQQIEYKMVRKINEFQDQLHDKYKLLQSEIQYLYDSINKQREEFVISNDKILKNVIQFYSQNKENKIKQWQNKFKTDILSLKKSSIRINCNDQLFYLVKNIQYYFHVQPFEDQNNQYLISTARQLISSNTKRKHIQSPRWNQDKENMFTTRPTHNKYYQTDQINKKNLIDTEKSVIHALNEVQFNKNNQQQWSATKM